MRTTREMRSADGFVGDRASKRAFQSILDDWRERVSKNGDDPLGDAPSEELSKKQLDKLLLEGDPRGGGRRAGRGGGVRAGARRGDPALPSSQGLEGHRAHRRWRRMRQSRVGELAIGRAAVVLKASAWTWR